MNVLLSLLLAVSVMSVAQGPRQMPARVTAPKGWYVELYGKSLYEGPVKTYRSAIPDLGPSWSRRVRSAVIKGKWELCNKPNFTGECRTLKWSIADLKAWQFPGDVRSLRPLVPEKR